MTHKSQLNQGINDKIATIRICLFGNSLKLNCNNLYIVKNEKHSANSVTGRSIVTNPVGTRKEYM